MTHFNESANSWDTEEKIKLNQLYSEKILEKLSNKSSIKILELGCGTGLLGSHFISEKNQLTGVDTSSGMLDIFNNKFKDNKNVHSLLLNLEEQEIDENNFDLIISSMAFHHLVDPAKMVVKLKKLLSANGVLVIIDLDLENGTFHPDPKKMGVHHFGFSNEVTASWAKKADFKNYSREIINTLKKEQGDYPVFMSTFFN